MLEIKNHTALTVELLPGLDKNGYDYAVVIIKGVFNINPVTSSLSLSEIPAEIIKADVFYDKPGTSSVRYETDTAILKRSTDVVVNGHAYTENLRPSASTDVSLQLADHHVTYRVFGDRYWEKAGISWVPTPATKFDRMPLIYENAYGGVEQTTDKDKNPEFYAYNPIGKGFIPDKSKPLDGLPLANIENPRGLISSINDRPVPSGFGFIDKSWQPRLKLSGSFDDQWEKQRLPLLPLDFNDMYYNGAHPDLITKAPLSGGELISLKNLSESGLMSFTLPTWSAPVAVSIKGKSKDFLPTLDTVVIEPDENTVLLTWRVTVPCFKQFLYINAVTIGRRRKA
ncbi:MAG: DUF2169 domain-containing protein [Gammaproteobacteria bacterium]|nr:DUF2169 domain-containing protein [Gammaproteobacteria bacterium]